MSSSNGLVVLGLTSTYLAKLCFLLLLQQSGELTGRIQ
jgi:hypothetical protein